MHRPCKRNLAARSLATSATALAVAGSLFVATTAPAVAQIARPQSAQVFTPAGERFEFVRWRGRGGAAIGAGIAAGLLLGGAIAASRPGYYYAPGYYAPSPYYVAPPPTVVYEDEPDDAVAYCLRRFRSYNPASGTYMGYDGVRRSCP
ncbi:MAG: BA14K family protein [Proteobacteria bacterium]|nr:BA14K family protein [Pseudomonadota bacterium]